MAGSLVTDPLLDDTSSCRLSENGKTNPNGKGCVNCLQLSGQGFSAAHVCPEWGAIFVCLFNFKQPQILEKNV